MFENIKNTYNGANFEKERTQIYYLHQNAYELSEKVKIWKQNNVHFL